MAINPYRGVKNRIAFDRGELLSKIVTPQNVANRIAERHNGTNGVLNHWVDRLREGEGESVPYFDPRAAANGVKVLMVLQDPSGAADGESGFISLYNNDQTAHNVYKLSLATGLDYGDFFAWNVIPWWVKNPAKSGGKRKFTAEARRARPFLIEMLETLPEPPAVILVLGKSITWPAWESAMEQGTPNVLKRTKTLFSAHPSNQSIRQVDKDTGVENWTDLLAKFKFAASLIS